MCDSRLTVYEIFLSLSWHLFPPYSHKLPHTPLSHAPSGFSSPLIISAAFFTDTTAQDAPETETSALLLHLYFITVCFEILVTVSTTEEDGAVEVTFTEVKCGGSLLNHAWSWPSEKSWFERNVRQQPLKHNPFIKFGLEERLNHQNVT